MNKNVTKNYIYNVIYQVLTLVVPLITTPYVSKILSVDGIGIYSFTYSIAAFFALIAELGTIAYARREIAFVQEDKEERSKIFWEILIFRIITTLICLIVYYIYILRSEYVIIGLFQMLYIIAVIFDITWFYQGMEDFKTIVIRNSAIKIFMVFFIFIGIKSEDDLLKYILGLACLPLIGNMIAWTSLKKYVKKIPLKNLKPFRHLKGTINLFIPNIASQVYLLLDKTMLGFLTVDNIENGYYEQAQKIIKMCWTFLTTFATVMAPRIAYTYTRNDDKALKKYMDDSFNVIWLIASALCFGIISISNMLVPWFLGEEYNKVIYLLDIFAFILFPIGIASITGTQYLVTIKKHQIYTGSIITGAILNIIMNSILIPKYYSIGAAISSVAAEVIIVVIQIIYIICYDKKFTFKDIFGSSLQYIIAGLVMLFILSNISVYMNANIMNTVVLIAVGATIYFFVLILFKNKLIFEGVNFIKNKLYRRNDENIK